MSTPSPDDDPAEDVWDNVFRSTQRRLVKNSMSEYTTVVLNDLTRRTASIHSALAEWHEGDTNATVRAIVEKVRALTQFFMVSGQGMCIGKTSVATRNCDFDPSNTTTWSVGPFLSRAYMYGDFILCALVCIDDHRVPKTLREHGVDRHVWACAWERMVKGACESDPEIGPLMNPDKADAGGGSITGSNNLPIIYVAIPRTNINGLLSMNEPTMQEWYFMTVPYKRPKPPSARRGDGVRAALLHGW